MEEHDASSDSEYKCNSDSDSDSDSGSTYITTKGRRKKETKAKKSKSTMAGGASRFQRVWSENDEIVILEAFIKYSTDNSISDIGGFYHFIKDSLNPNITKRQLSDKLKRLKKKFQDNESKTAELLAFPKSHDKKVFDLSKMLWGKTSNANATANVANENAVPIPSATKNRPMKKKKVLKKISDDYDPVIALPLLLEVYLCDHGLDLDWVVDSKEELEKRWKKAKLAESRYFYCKSKVDIATHILKLEDPGAI